MPAKIIVAPGTRYDKLVVVKEAEKRQDPNGSPVRWMLCRCDCGTLKEIRLKDLRNGKSRSCGCVHRTPAKNRAVMEPGAQFERLTFLNETEPLHDPDGKPKRMGLFLCDCGNIKEFPLKDIRNGKTKGCGCQKLRHGMSFSPEYHAWTSMQARCFNTNDADWKNYGGRGIGVYPGWVGRGGFERWFAHIGPRPSSAHSQDRIDNDGNYEPGNVRWATAKVQANNKRSH